MSRSRGHKRTHAASFEKLGPPDIQRQISRQKIMPLSVARPRVNTADVLERVHMFAATQSSYMKVKAGIIREFGRDAFATHKERISVILENVEREREVRALQARVLAASTATTTSSSSDITTSPRQPSDLEDSFEAMKMGRRDRPADEDTDAGATVLKRAREVVDAARSSLSTAALLKLLELEFGMEASRGAEADVRALVENMRAEVVQGVVELRRTRPPPPPPVAATATATPALVEKTPAPACPWCAAVTGARQFFSDAAVNAHAVASTCTMSACPCMRAGHKFVYTWLENEDDNDVVADSAAGPGPLMLPGQQCSSALDATSCREVRLSGQEYTDAALHWVDATLEELDSESYAHREEQTTTTNTTSSSSFPCGCGCATPHARRRRRTVRRVYISLFRLYAHWFHHHFRHFAKAGKRQQLTQSFARLWKFVKDRQEEKKESKHDESKLEHRRKPMAPAENGETGVKSSSTRVSLIPRQELQPLTKLIACLAPGGGRLP